MWVRQQKLSLANILLIKNNYVKFNYVIFLAHWTRVKYLKKNRFIKKAKNFPNFLANKLIYEGVFITKLSNQGTFTKLSNQGRFVDLH